MNDFLKSIKLIEEFTITLNCPRSYFIRALEQNTDSSGFELFESWSSGPPFKGRVSGDKFSIRTRKQASNSNRMMSVKLSGTVATLNEKSFVTVEANAVNITLTSSLLFLAVFLSFGLYTSFTTEMFPFFLLAFAFQLAAVFGILYFALRRVVRLTKRELEKEFLWIIRNYVPT